MMKKISNYSKTAIIIVIAANRKSFFGFILLLQRAFGRPMQPISRYFVGVARTLK